MTVLLRGIIGGLGFGGAPRPSGAGCTRQPAGCCSGVGGGGVAGLAGLSAGESGKHSGYSGASSRLSRPAI